MATYTWSIPTGKEITGTTYIKDTDNNISDTVNDLVEFVNGEGAHAGQGLTFDLVDKASAQTISGIKTFSSTIVGNTDSATVLETARDFSAEGDIVVAATSFDGSANIVLSASFRSGMIMMWSGTVALIPSGWWLCDGTNGTPDLRGRAVMGAIDDGVADFSVGGSGDGSVPSHVHNVDHNHTASFSGNALAPHSHTYDRNREGDYLVPASVGVGMGFSTVPTGSTSGGTPSGSVTVDTKTMNTGTYGTGTDVVPKYYALCYIMKG